MSIKRELVLASILLFLILGYVKPAAAQVEHISVQKDTCFHDVDKIDGHKLVIIVKARDTTISTPKDFYDLDGIIGLSDSIKLNIIEQLLKFKNDQSICCRKVGKYYYEGIERTCIGKPKSQIYSIQIDALYLINKIVHPYGTSMYSCFPVVVNRETQKEINDCPELIVDYYRIYEKFFEEAKKTNVISNNFNFNTIKYAWFGADPNTIK